MAATGAQRYLPLVRPRPETHARTRTFFDEIFSSVERAFPPSELLDPVDSTSTNQSPLAQGGRKAETMIETATLALAVASVFRFLSTWLTLRFLWKVYDRGGPAHVQKVSAALPAGARRREAAAARPSGPQQARLAVAAPAMAVTSPRNDEPPVAKISPRQLRRRGGSRDQPGTSASG